MRTVHPIPEGRWSRLPDCCDRLRRPRAPRAHGDAPVLDVRTPGEFESALRYNRPILATLLAPETARRLRDGLAA